MNRSLRWLLVIALVAGSGIVFLMSDPGQGVSAGSPVAGSPAAPAGSAAPLLDVEPVAAPDLPDERSGVPLAAPFIAAKPIATIDDGAFQRDAVYGGCVDERVAVNQWSQCRMNS